MKANEMQKFLKWFGQRPAWRDGYNLTFYEVWLSIAIVGNMGRKKFLYYKYLAHTHTLISTRNLQDCVRGIEKDSRGVDSALNQQQFAEIIQQTQQDVFYRQIPPIPCQLGQKSDEIHPVILKTAEGFIEEINLGAPKNSLEYALQSLIIYHYLKEHPEIQPKISFKVDKANLVDLQQLEKMIDDYGVSTEQIRKQLVNQYQLIHSESNLNNGKNKFEQTLQTFVSYSVTYICYGLLITGVGPLIPYLAARANVLETQYSFLFLCRAVGMFLGGFATKVMQKRVTLHTMIISCILCLIFGALFSQSESFFWLGFNMFMISIGCCILQVAVDIGMLLAHSGNNQEFWMQLIHGVFGIGGLLGPLMVYIFETDSYMVMGILFALTAPIFLVLKSPEDPNFHDAEQKQNQLLQKSKGAKNKQVSRNIEIMICVMFFLYNGMEITYGGWISSYAVMNEVSTKEQATVHSSVFWIVMTFFRFLTAFLPGKISAKIKICILSSLAIVGVASVMAMSHLYRMSVIFSSITVGIALAAQFPLYLTLPSEFGMELHVSQFANVMIACTLGQAILSMITGYLMGLISPNMIYYSLALFAVIMYLLFLKLMKMLHQFQLTIVKFDQATLNGVQIPTLPKKKLEN